MPIDRISRSLELLSATLQPMVEAVRSLKATVPRSTPDQEKDQISTPIWATLDDDKLLGEILGSLIKTKTGTC